jgi:hypothetical protein
LHEVFEHRIRYVWGGGEGLRSSPKEGPARVSEGRRESRELSTRAESSPQWGYRITYKRYSSETLQLQKGRRRRKRRELKASTVVKRDGWLVHLLWTGNRDVVFGT